MTKRAVGRNRLCMASSCAPVSMWYHGSDLALACAFPAFTFTCAHFIDVLEVKAAEVCRSFLCAPPTFYHPPYSD